jgi:uncharacterized protein HemY
MKTQCTSDELLEAAVIASMRLKYRCKGYESEEKALKALRRRCSGLAPEQYQQALSDAGELYEAAEKLVVARMGAAPAADRPEELKGVRRELEQRYTGFPAGAYESAVGWAHVWRIQM